jgi:hypothetical protein
MRYQTRVGSECRLYHLRQTVFTDRERSHFRSKPAERAGLAQATQEPVFTFRILSGINYPRPLRTAPQLSPSAGVRLQDPSRGKPPKRAGYRFRTRAGQVKPRFPAADSGSCSRIPRNAEGGTTSNPLSSERGLTRQQDGLATAPDPPWCFRPTRFSTALTVPSGRPSPPSNTAREATAASERWH